MMGKEKPPRWAVKGVYMDSQMWMLAGKLFLLLLIPAFLAGIKKSAHAQAIRYRRRKAIKQTAVIGHAPAK